MRTCSEAGVPPVGRECSRLGLRGRAPLSWLIVCPSLRLTNYNFHKLTVDLGWTATLTQSVMSLRRRQSIITGRLYNVLWPADNTRDGHPRPSLFSATVLYQRPFSTRTGHVIQFREKSITASACVLVYVNSLSSGSGLILISVDFSHLTIVPNLPRSLALFIIGVIFIFSYTYS